MSLKINNKISDDVKNKILERFKLFIKACGGASLVAKDSIFSHGYIRGILGSKTRLPSPRIVLILSNRYRYIINKKFTRDY